MGNIGIGQALAIFSDIENPGFSEEIKALAIYKVLEMPTHNGVTKDKMLEVIRWLWNLRKEEQEEKEIKKIPKLIIHGDEEEYWGIEEICPDCGKHWMSAFVGTSHFCPGCGRPVKWE